MLPCQISCWAVAWLLALDRLNGKSPVTECDEVVPDCATRCPVDAVQTVSTNHQLCRFQHQGLSAWAGALQNQHKWSDCRKDIKNCLTYFLNVISWNTHLFFFKSYICFHFICEKKRDSIHWFPPSECLVKARAWARLKPGTSSGLSHGCQGPQYLSPHLLPPSLWLQQEALYEAEKLRLDPVTLTWGADISATEPSTHSFIY